ncbi:FtsX-like permease family protein [Spiroplasma culicicola]|uniref:ABC3 transporter permease C-terminal domain-containing protein n=1 Tax=Spiroplasma culicicola AES-1 TaxID=1276246 RepID=W6AFP9_9MOLU|nr:hypothetical protein [Spiroplasma culicicola]AHI52534.1 hypothetical protein SCULI_v1c01930 [Spiroplasma culicicola AES-1]
MKLAINFFKLYFKSNIIILFTFIITVIVLMSSLNLFLSIFLNEIETNHATLVFIIIPSVTALMAIILTIRIIKMNFKVREKTLINLRIIGISHNQIYKALLLEFLSLMAIAIIIGFGFNIIATNWIIKLFTSHNVIGPEYKIVNYFALLIPFTIVASLFLMKVFDSATSNLKNISMSNLNLTLEKFKKKHIFTIIIGLIFLASYITLIIFFDEVVLYLFGGIFFFIAMQCLGKYILFSIWWVMSKIFSKVLFLKLIFNRLKENTNKNFEIFLLIIITYSFLNFGVNSLVPTANDTIYNADPLNEIYYYSLLDASVVLAVFISLYSIILIFNNLYLYFEDQISSNNNLYRIGLEKWKICLTLLVESLFILILEYLFGFIPSLFQAVIWKHSFIVNDYNFWLILSLVTMSINIIIPCLFFNRIKNKS